ncbi:MAG: chemotaxis protein CheX [Desulfobacterales bacterium]
MSSPIDIKQIIAASVTDLFETMLSFEIVLTDRDAAPALPGERIIGSLSFAGHILGSINIQLGQPFAREMTAAMLGMDLEDIESLEEVKDVVREACNIIGGNLKTAIENAGIPCAISTPSITDGDDFELETIGADRHERLSFKCGAHGFTVELAIKAAEQADRDTQRRLKAIDVSKFSRLDIISSTGDKVIELFDVMLSMPLQLSDAETPFASGTSRMLGSLSFAGQVLGNIQIQVSEAFARIIAASMLGIGEDEIGSDDELKDVVGEMANIVGGNLKAAFNDSGLNCRISPPNITTGRNFNIETANMDRYERFAFRYKNHDILVEVCVKIDETAKPQTQQAVGPTEAGEDTAAAVAETPPQGPAASGENHSQSDAGVLNRDNLSLILDIPLTLTVELGCTRMEIEDLLRLEPGGTMTMANLEGEPLDILANEKLVARGEVVVEKEKYAIRITEIVSRLERIKSLR